MAVIEVNGARFGYDEAGDGPPVVLVHATVADRRMWEHQFRALASTHRVVRFDWRGYGDSDDAVGQFARYEDVLAVMDALRIERAVLVGCAMGGAQCLEAALAAPGRVRALALICCGLSDYEWPPELTAAMAAKIVEVIPPEVMAAYRDGRADRIDPVHARGVAEINLQLSLLGPGRCADLLEPETWRLAMDMCTAMLERQWRRAPSEERFLEPAASTRLAEIKVPTLVIKALTDEPTLAAISDRLAEQIAGARLLELADTSRMAPLERPQQVSLALTDFLSSLD
ncbi:alpha/beta hydrolase [Actinocrinis sp.]|uniref:alpha/beta fold hydrolase n=1 Tax=Actinocrinis sp. TaxID=1920516 RepID=UPI002D682195|nr:alpha/beta hydrolase [Actinocrinis sp.]HZP52010.1 alpha/beta hydrolase [Actinocrinis sp.]